MTFSLVLPKTTVIGLKQYTETLFPLVQNYDGFSQTYLQRSHSAKTRCGHGSGYARLTEN